VEEIRVLHMAPYYLMFVACLNAITKVLSVSCSRENLVNTLKNVKVPQNTFGWIVGEPESSLRNLKVLERIPRFL